MAKERFNAYEKTVYAFANNIWVVCPNGPHKALVRSKGFLEHKNENEVKLVCKECGANKFYSEKPKDKWISQEGKVEYAIRNLIIGQNVDPYFGLPLWLQKEMPDGLLWAYNDEHLEFIARHVGAELRFRNVGNPRNQSLGARLPKWMTSKKNRKEVRLAIEKLKQK